MFTLRILLVLCDVNDHQSALKELTKLSIINNLSLILAWSAEEAGRYVETYKSFEHKPPDLIRERVGEDFLSQVTNVLTQVRGVNRTDVVTLLSRFGSLKGVVRGAMEGEEVGLCPGFGEVKARRLRDVFSQPFRVGESRTYEDRKLANHGQGQSGNVSSGTCLIDPPMDLLPTSTAINPKPTSAHTCSFSSNNNNKRALDSLQDSLNTLDEEQLLHLAIQLSMPSP